MEPEISERQTSKQAPIEPQITQAFIPNSKSSFLWANWLIIVSFIVVLLISISGGIFLINKQNVNNTAASQKIATTENQTSSNKNSNNAEFSKLTVTKTTNPTTTPMPAIAVTSPKQNTTGWKTFTNNEYSLQYPPDWTVTRTDISAAIFFPKNATLSTESTNYDHPVGGLIWIYSDHSTQSPESCTQSYCPTIESAKDSSISGMSARLLTGNEWTGQISCDCKYEKYVLKHNTYYYKFKVLGENNPSFKPLAPVPTPAQINSDLLNTFNTMASTFKFTDNVYVNATSNWKTYDNGSDMSFKFPNTWTPTSTGAQNINPKMAIARVTDGCSTVNKHEQIDGATIQYCQKDATTKMIRVTPILNGYITNMIFTYSTSMNEDEALDIFYKILSTAHFKPY